jgi:hypothetical protein
VEGPSSPDSQDDPLQGLARELRQTVGAEMRAEAEITEHETEVGRRRRRTMSDVVRETAERGDRISLVTSVRTVTGTVTQVGRDYLTVATEAELVDARLAGIIAVIDPRPSGGTLAGAQSITFQARLSEYEQTREAVTVVAPRIGHTVEGIIDIVARDHVIVVDRDGATTMIPTEAIDLVLRPRPPRR